MGWRAKVLLCSATRNLSYGVCLASLCFSPAHAQIQYPISIPAGCIALAQRENIPLVVESYAQGLKLKMRLKFVRSDPLVDQCRIAVREAEATYKLLKKQRDGLSAPPWVGR